MGRAGARKESSLVVWAVGVASSIGFAFQALDASLDGRFDKVRLWTFASILAFGLALAIERYKATGRR